MNLPEFTWIYLNLPELNLPSLHAYYKDAFSIIQKAHPGNYWLKAGEGIHFVHKIFNSYQYAQYVAIKYEWKKIQAPLEDQLYTTPGIIKQLKKAMLKSVQNQTLNYRNEKIKKLTFQGDLAQLLREEKTLRHGKLF